MKKIILLILIVIGNYYNCQKINLLKLQKEEFTNIIDEIYNETDTYYDWNKAIFTINIMKYPKYYRIEISIAYKQDADYILRNNKSHIYGFLEYNNHPILVFSNDVSPFFCKTDKTIILDWLKLKKEKKYKIPPPPIIYEPKIWIYKFTNNTFEFIRYIN